jgi:hypothetical protein
VHKKLSANREANFNYRKTGLSSGGGGGGGLVISNRFTYLAALHELSQNIGNQTKLQQLSLSQNCIFSVFESLINSLKLVIYSLGYV